MVSIKWQHSDSRSDHRQTEIIRKSWSSWIPRPTSMMTQLTTSLSPFFLPQKRVKRTFMAMVGHTNSRGRLWSYIKFLTKKYELVHLPRKEEYLEFIYARTTIDLNFWLETKEMQRCFHNSSVCTNWNQWRWFYPSRDRAPPAHSPTWARKEEKGRTAISF